MRCSLVFCTALAVLVFVHCEDELFVQVKNGVMRGKYMETKGGRKILSFTGIPYAKPPIGELRFKPPQPADNWNGVLDATEVHAVCPQRNTFTRSSLIEGDEDCLFLNVYVPKVESKEKKLLPVMFFLHGGGYFCCSGNTWYYGPDILLDRDVILVVPNYRLGPLGFLTTGDSVVPGNNGLKDQALALKWIHENIAKFGGDRNKITAFGESAGGASVHLLMMSPLTKGLFANAISQSGTAFCPWAFEPEQSKNQGVEHSRRLAKLLNCPTDSSQEMVDCLRKVEPFEFIKHDVEFLGWDTDPIVAFKPVVEPKHSGAFIDEHPVDLIKAGKVSRVPWIVGINTGDGALRSASVMGIPKLLKELNEDYENKAPITFMFDQTSDEPKRINDEMRSYYFSNKAIDQSMKQNVTDAYTDSWFMSGIDRAVYLHRKHLNQPIYYYLLGFKGVASYSQIFGDPVNDYGVSHADELQYLFPVLDNLFPTIQRNDAQKKMETLISTMWTNLAYHGHPTPELNDVVKSKWSPIKSLNEMEYLYIGDFDDVKMESGMFQERVMFWRKLRADVTTNEIMRDEL